LKVLETPLRMKTPDGILMFLNVLAPFGSFLIRGIRRRLRGAFVSVDNVFTDKSPNALAIVPGTSHDVEDRGVDLPRNTPKDI
jgi:hypothetical protein